MSIITFVRKHKKIDYLQKAIRHMNDKEFVDAMLDYRRGYHVLTFRDNPKGTIDARPYHICVGNDIDGFFAIFRETLSACFFSDRMGFLPVIEWDKSVKYYDKNCSFAKGNPYEQYFKQPGRIGLENLEQCKQVLQFDRSHEKYAETIGKNSTYMMSDEYLDAMGDIERKYIILNPDMEKRLRTDIENVIHSDETVLGVHYRGTDFKNGYRNHPAFVTVDDYKRTIDELLQKGYYRKLFIATDDADALNYFRKHYGEMVCFYGATKRGSSNTSVMFSESDRPHHEYELGYEVFRDMWTLAHCNGLVAGLSQVSICARISKRSLEQNYTDEVILSNGVNHKGKIYKGI